MIINRDCQLQAIMKTTCLSTLGLIMPMLIAHPVMSQESLPSQSAELITVPVGSQSSRLRSQLQLPEHQHTMEQVIQMLGEPKQIYTIGQPVITRWSYGNMTVYFERDRVLRTVVHNTPSETATVVEQKQ